MDNVGRERSRSLRFVQIVFATLGLLSLAAGLATALINTETLGLPDASANAIAFGFLGVGVMNTALMFVWERIYDSL